MTDGIQGFFAVGDKVKRVNSDYQMPGTVVAKFTKVGGTQIRYVVQDDRGTLFIMSDKNLERRNDD